MSQAFHLFQLQKIDTQLDQIQSRLNQIEVILQSNETLKQAEQNNTAAALSLKAAQTALQHTETAVQNQRVKIETCDATLYSGRIKITKELQDITPINETARTCMPTIDAEYDTVPGKAFDSPIIPIIPVNSFPSEY